MHKLNAILVVFSIGVTFVTIPCFAEAYKWIDENGVVNFTDDTSKMPRSPQSLSTQSQPMIAEKPTHDSPLKTSPTLIIRKMLSNKDFKKLNTTLLDYHKAYQQDIHNEDALLDAFLAFSIGDGSYEPLLNDWVSNHPESYQPYLARASYFYNLGWKSRGGKWGVETTDEQLEAMRNYFSRAKRDIEQVLMIKPNHIVPYYFLINIYKAMGRKYEVKEITKKALKENPNSFRIRSAYLLALAPKWHGTYKEMDQFAIESQQYVSENPRLKALQGYAFYDAGSMQSNAKNYGVALKYLGEALSFGDLAIFYEERADIYYRMDRDDEALKDINSAIAIAPQNADFYYMRSKIFGSKKMMQEALKDIELAGQLNPNNEDIAKQKKWIADTFLYSGHSQQKTRNLSGAIVDFNAAIQANPNNADAYYRRARAFIDKKDLVSAFNDLRKTIELDPNNFDFYLLMDWLLTQKSDWNGIISNWSKYITLNPHNDRAYLERGGAFFRKGDLPSAVADAKKAADLGNAEGQKVYDKYKDQVKK